MSARVLGVLGLVLGLGAVGCASPHRSEPFSGNLVLTGKAAPGQIAFMRYCNGCHPHGESGLGPSLNNKPLPVPAMKLQVRTGIVGGSMPSFPPSEISDEELDQITNWISSIRKVEHHE